MGRFLLPTSKHLSSTHLLFFIYANAGRNAARRSLSVGFARANLVTPLCVNVVIVGDHSRCSSSGSCSNCLPPKREQGAGSALGGDPAPCSLNSMATKLVDAEARDRSGNGAANFMFVEYASTEE